MTNTDNGGIFSLTNNTVIGGKGGVTMRENILKLMASSISTYRIAKESGIPENTVRRLRNQEASLDNVRFSLAEKLNQYYLEVVKMNTVILDNKELELDVLAEYMDDELRESVNDEKFANNQEYIELYIERAKEEDPGFIEVLDSEFGVTV